MGLTAKNNGEGVRIGEFIHKGGINGVQEDLVHAIEHTEEVKVGIEL